MIKKMFFNNYLLMLPILSWITAQVCKTLIDLLMTKKFTAERLLSSGGMPSSHAALVCSLFIGTVRKLGPSSPLCAVTFVLAMVVIYDAMGVRLETGKQARLLNRIIEDLRNESQAWNSEKKLKELVGHTPLQVLCGALLGVLLAILIPVF
jgi:acid phosphatase family membrane protein YuiD